MWLYVLVPIQANTTTCACLVSCVCKNNQVIVMDTSIYMHVHVVMKAHLCI